MYWFLPPEMTITPSPPPLGVVTARDVLVSLEVVVACEVFVITGKVVAVVTAATRFAIFEGGTSLATVSEIVEGIVFGTFVFVMWIFSVVNVVLLVVAVVGTSIDNGVETFNATVVTFTVAVKEISVLAVVSIFVVVTVGTLSVTFFSKFGSGNVVTFTVND